MAENTENKDYINQMYDASLESQKQQLATNYETSTSDLEAEKQAAAKAADANLSRTYVEAQKAAKNYNEVQNAYGLTSGAMAQARLAQDNQLQADLTTIRAAQQETDAEIERQRSILSQQYAAAIAQAQADNDLQRAQALYEEAKDAESQLLSQQQNAASLMAGAGDFSLYQALYGLTDEQVNALVAQYNRQNYTSVSPSYSGEDTSSASSETMASILALGRGVISAATLNELVETGQVIEYEDNGVLKYKNADTSTNPYTNILAPSVG